jgi:hypothetical protein
MRNQLLRLGADLRGGFDVLSRSERVRIGMLQFKPNLPDDCPSAVPGHHVLPHRRRVREQLLQFDGPVPSQ